jgi:hypothetical protein
LRIDQGLPRLGVSTKGSRSTVAVLDPFTRRVELVFGPVSNVSPARHPDGVVTQLVRA